MSNQQIIYNPEFWLVWEEGSDRYTPTHKHNTYEGALTEAKRLTREHGGEFHVLAHMATTERNDITIRQVQSMPF